MRNAAYVKLIVTQEEAWRGDYSPRENPITPQELYDRRLDCALTAWLLAHYDTLREGYWPDIKPEEIPSHGGAHRHGWFENAIMYGAMVKIRQESCGFDGCLLWLFYHDNKGTEDMAQRFNQTEDRIIKRINRALKYCAGWKNKRRGYRDWYRRDYHKRREQCETIQG